MTWPGPPACTPPPAATCPVPLTWTVTLVPSWVPVTAKYAGMSAAGQPDWPVMR